MSITFDRINKAIECINAEDAQTIARLKKTGDYQRCLDHERDILIEYIAEAIHKRYTDDIEHDILLFETSIGGCDIDTLRHEIGKVLVHEINTMGNGKSSTLYTPDAQREHYRIVVRMKYIPKKVKTCGPYKPG